MKIRQCFVSNSSSSSFIINLKDITAMQLVMIQNHSEVAKAIGGYDNEPWDIDIEGAEVRGYTFMDNFDMHHYLVNVVGVDEDLIRWD
jgi:hypothetical protein